MQKRSRLRANADFQRVHRHGTRLVNRHLVLVYLPNDRDTSRVGFAVGKKLGGAVERNRIKRRLRELMRHRLAEGAIPPRRDVVIIARDATRDASYEAMRQALDELLQRAGWGRKEPSA